MRVAHALVSEQQNLLHHNSNAYLMSSDERRILVECPKNDTNEMMTGFKIDFAEKFQHLKNAPIVEAVVSIHARPDKRLDEAELLSVLKSKLPDYPHAVSQNESSVTFQITEKGTAPAAGQNISWKGVLFQSADKLQIAQFNRDGFVFSRLSPYKEWDHLSSEAFRLFEMFVEVTRPREIQRLGLRFVNRFQMPPGEFARMTPCARMPLSHTLTRTCPLPGMRVFLSHSFGSLVNKLPKRSNVACMDGPMC
jgi:hypothetical protein